MKTRSNSMRSAMLTFVIVVAGAVRAANADGPASLRAPERLSETGLYADIAAHRVDEHNLPYEPQYPLWTDGAEKSRWIRLPAGTTIDARDTDAWVFPVGTKLWKEFAFGGHKVETRLLWRASKEQWIFASYAWNEEQTDAMLVPDSGLRNVREIAPGVRHSIPSQTECRSCHESGGTPSLGFNALQLSDDRDPLAPHAQPLKPGSLTLSALDRLGLLSPRRPDLVRNPPRIQARSPRERAVLGYLSANCGSCHNSRGPLAPVGLELLHTEASAQQGVERGLATTVGVDGDYVVPGAAAGSSHRVTPGAPDASTIVYRMSSRRPSSQMPPLGSGIADADAIALVREWVSEDLKGER